VWRSRLVQLPMLGGVRLSTPPASQPALAVVTTRMLGALGQGCGGPLDA
jgi:hypothetical protein